MTPEPYPSSFAPQPQGPQDLNAPGVGLIVAGSLGLLTGLIQIASSLVQMVGGARGQAFDNPNLPPMFKSYMNVLSSGAISLVVALVILTVNALILFGGIKMRAGQNYSVCVAAAGLCCVPCCFHSCCSLFVIPLGVWALTVLFGARGKANFTS